MPPGDGPNLTPQSWRLRPDLRIFIFTFDDNRTYAPATCMIDLDLHPAVNGARDDSEQSHHDELRLRRPSAAE